MISLEMPVMPHRRPGEFNYRSGVYIEGRLLFGALSIVALREGGRIERKRRNREQGKIRIRALALVHLAREALCC